MATQKRAPVVAVMGHIDHGKSTLLDTIRKSNVVAGEHGGITQHVSAYEVTHERGEGDEKITFLDTPGHEAFGAIRGRGAEVADVAVLVVAADDGVMTQTKEALSAITSAEIPYIVAINKIDKPGANPTKTKQDLTDAEILIEEYGGDVPAIELSALQGDGIDELLETILLIADVAELTCDDEALANGVVLESDIDTRRGIAGTLIIKNGRLSKGDFVATDGAYAPVRILEDFNGKSIHSATPSSPVSVAGWSELPIAGSVFKTFKTKAEAESYATTGGTSGVSGTVAPGEDVIPLTIKTDAAGTLDAVIHEVNKLDQEMYTLQIVKGAIGNITKEDIEFAAGNEKSIVVGFGVKIDSAAKGLAERQEVSVETFPIIYKLVEWLQKKIEEKRTAVTVEEENGTAKVLKQFSSQKNNQVIGCRIEKGEFAVKNTAKVIRRDNQIGTAKIKGIKVMKNDVQSIREDNECGMSVESAITIAPGDKLIAFETVEK
jgi:translation initiation factor IF-2